MRVARTASRPRAGASCGPIRTCVGCGAKAHPRELVRLRLVDGQVHVDASRSGGRGAWLHASGDCVDRATKRKAFGRAFRASSVQADPRVLRELLTGNARKY